MAADEDQRQIERQAGRTIASALVDAISLRIVRGEYRPGERLIEADLARDFGVGRGSVREALRRLQANHYIRFEPNRGAAVARPSVEEMIEMLRIRAAIAGVGARAAAERIDLPGHRDRVEGLLAELETERAQGSTQLHRVANGHFHRVINEISGMRHIGELMDQINIPMFYDIYFNELNDQQWRHNLDDHYDLARAILAGDGDAAEHFAKRHMSRNIKIVRSIAIRWQVQAAGLPNSR